MSYNLLFDALSNIDSVISTSQHDMDIWMNDNTFNVEVALPGYDKSKISIIKENNYLTITAEKVEKDKSREKCRHWMRTIKNNAFTQKIYLPDGLVEDADAEYNNGILRVKIKKQETKIGKRIELKT